MEESYCSRKSAYRNFNVVTTCSNKVVCLVEAGIPNAKTSCLRLKSDRPGCQIFCPSTATIFGRQRFPQVSVQLGAVHLLSRSAIPVFHFQLVLPPFCDALFPRRPKHHIKVASLHPLFSSSSPISLPPPPLAVSHQLSPTLDCFCVTALTTCTFTSFKSITHPQPPASIFGRDVPHHAHAFSARFPRGVRVAGEHASPTPRKPQYLCPAPGG